MRLGIKTAILATSLALAAPAFAQHAEEHVQHAETAQGHTTYDPEARAGAKELEADAEGKADRTEAEHGPPKPINWFDFGNKEQPPFGMMILNFLILMGIYWWFGRTPIANALKSRRAEVAKQIEEAQRIRHEAEERAVKYQEKLKHLEEELRETRTTLVEAGKAERERIVREAEEKAARMERDATFLIEQEIKQLRQDLLREAVEMASAAAEELLRKRVTPVDQERLAEDYLAELTAKNKTASIPASRPPAPAAAPINPPLGGGHS